DGAGQDRVPADGRLVFFAHVRGGRIEDHGDIPPFSKMMGAEGEEQDDGQRHSEKRQKDRSHRVTSQLEDGRRRLLGATPCAEENDTASPPVPVPSALDRPLSRDG
ncbi:MAG: hypothetical protein ACXWKO_17995, partial [Phenylobacterium sp.]